MATMTNAELNERFSRIAQAIARLEHKTDFILQELKLEYIDKPESNIPPGMEEVYAFLKLGKRLEAIQAYRKQTGAGYDQARVAVEEIEMGSPHG
ncbi:MAG: hypothetical protein HY741_24240 [Chloroflexi bacterium]|nr:hypothetical protein [Chloroflexota bacterium]